MVLDGSLRCCALGRHSAAALSGELVHEWRWWRIYEVAITPPVFTRPRRAYRRWGSQALQLARTRRASTESLFVFWMGREHACVALATSWGVGLACWKERERKPPRNQRAISFTIYLCISRKVRLQAPHIPILRASIAWCRYRDD